MNPDAAGQPLDTQLRLYQLNGTAQEARSTSLTSLWREDEDILGPALVSRVERITYISRPFTFQLATDASSTHLLLVARLRRPLANEFMRELTLPIHYMKGACEQDIANAPTPCLFVRIEDKQIAAGFSPPPRFDMRHVPRGACPSPYRLFPAQSSKRPPTT